MITSLCLLFLLQSGPGEDGGPRPSPTLQPLTEEQLSRVRTLVKRTQDEQAGLKRRLEKAQKGLARCYASYDLDDEAVKKHHAEILDLQGKLLTSYHAMQKDLRAIVGPERFKVLRRRIDNALAAPPAKQE